MLHRFHLDSHMCIELSGLTTSQNGKLKKLCLAGGSKRLWFAEKRFFVERFLATDSSEACVRQKQLAGVDG